jgi:uncharacterized protein YjbI with pentapeptide repeats
MSRSISIIIILIFLVSGGQGQDIIFKNPTTKPNMQYLDSAVFSRRQVITVDIGPESKLPQNTIFFNAPFRFQRDSIKSLRIKGVYIKKMILDTCFFGDGEAKIDSTDFDTLVINYSSFMLGLEMNNVTVNHLELHGNDKPDLHLTNCHIKNFIAKKERFGEVDFYQGILDNADLSESSFIGHLELKDVSIADSLTLTDCSFIGNLYLSNLSLRPSTVLGLGFYLFPDTLDLSGTEHFPPNTRIYSLNPKPDDFRLNNETHLNLSGADIQNLDINYDHVDLVFNGNARTDDIEHIYEAILQNFKVRGYQNCYEKLDIKYKSFQGQNGRFSWFWWVPYYWWEYGYDKARVFTISFLAIILLTGYNFFRFNHLIKNVYPIEGLSTAYSRDIGIKLWRSFVFTCIVFFSLSLKLDKINFNERRGAVWIMLIYLFGLVCLAYMANFVLQR